MKTRKIMSIMLVVATLLTSLCMFATGTSAAADVWDGKSANIKWYTDNTAATEFTISNGAELYGLSMINRVKDAPNAAVNGDGKLYYEAATGKVIFDAAQIGADTPYVAGDKFAGKTIKLGADIDLGGHSFAPIGNSGSFQAMFDGQNYTISNVKITEDGGEHKSNAYKTKQFYCGLFALVANANGGVKNLKIKNEVIDVTIPETAEKIWIGGVVASAHKNGCTVSNVSVDGLTINVRGTSAPNISILNIGGIFGTFDTPKNQADITVTNYVLNNEQTVFTAATTDDMVYGKAGANGTGTFTNCSVTLKAPDSGDNNNDNTGSNPETGDMTALVAVVAVMTLALGAVVVAKKRAHR